MCRVHARVRVCVRAMYVYAHRDGGVLHNCAALDSPGLSVYTFTRAREQGEGGEEGRRTGSRRRGGVGQRREIRIRCLFVSFVLRDESEEGIGEGSEGWGEGNERRESYPCTVDIRLRFRFYTRLTCYV